MNSNNSNFNAQKISLHVASSIQADTLFTFTKRLQYFSEWILSQRLFTRYNIENIEYLNVANVKKIAFPMKCFCDINLHRLKNHVKSFGYYGIAFTKQWGLDHYIQPVQYINNHSNLAHDISEVLNTLFSEEPEENENEDQRKLKCYAAHQLLYYKPYSDNKHCFSDECEWRFLPTVPDGLPPAILDEQDLSRENLNRLNDIIKQNPALSLPFEFSDIKYIIIKKENDFVKIVKTINGLKLTQFEKNVLISKIIIWDNSKEDF